MQYGYGRFFGAVVFETVMKLERLPGPKFKALELKEKRFSSVPSTRMKLTSIAIRPFFVCILYLCCSA
jgi:hypothetical protein